MPAPQLQHVIASLQSEEPVESYAAQHGLDAAALRAARELYLAGAASMLTQKPRRRWRYGLLAALVLAAALVPATVNASNCTAVVPAPLHTLCPNAPALASEVNANFKSLADLIIGRTGPISGPTSSPQDIWQRATAVWYAADNSFNLQADDVVLQNPNGQSGNALTATADDRLVINRAGLFSGGTRFEGNSEFPSPVRFDGNLSVYGTTTHAGQLNVNGIPRFFAGFSRHDCTWIGGIEARWGDAFSDAVCTGNTYSAGTRCRVRGQNDGNPQYSIFCQSLCCQP